MYEFSHSTSSPERNRMIAALAGVPFTLMQANVAAAPSPSDREEPRMIVHPVWIRRPVGDDMAAAYPAAAAERLINGRGLLVCTVKGQGRLTDCDVTGETPTGWGFGHAILSLAGKFQMRSLDRDGNPVTGGHVSIPVTLMVRGGH